MSFLPSELVYSGGRKLTDKVEDAPLDVGRLVLSPTRTYAPIVKKVIERLGARRINGMVHCSGGAQTKILHFLAQFHVIKDDLFDPPPLFRMIQRQSQTDWKEMYQVFNCGHRLEFYVERDVVGEIIEISKSFDVEAKIIGRVEQNPVKKLTIVSEFGEFTYF